MQIQKRGASMPPPEPSPSFPKKAKQDAAPEPAAGGSGGGRVDRVFARCGELLDQLLRHEHGWLFSAPVDARVLGLHDYYTVITDPMDLGTVRCRLQRRRYSDPDAFAADVRLTFSNAMSYNALGDPVYGFAAELSRVFESGWPSVIGEPSLAERRRRLREEMPRLPVSVQKEVVRIMEAQNACSWDTEGKAEVDLRKVDGETLDVLDWLVDEHRTGSSGAAAAKQGK